MGKNSYIGEVFAEPLQVVILGVSPLSPGLNVHSAYQVYGIL